MHHHRVRYRATLFFGIDWVLNLNVPHFLRDQQIKKGLVKTIGKGAQKYANGDGNRHRSRGNPSTPAISPDIAPRDLQQKKHQITRLIDARPAMRTASHPQGFQNPHWYTS